MGPGRGAWPHLAPAGVRFLHDVPNALVLRHDGVAGVALHHALRVELLVPGAQGEAHRVGADRLVLGARQIYALDAVLISALAEEAHRRLERLLLLRPSADARVHGA